MTREDYSKYYIQGSDHYLIPKDIFDELFNEMENWKKENQELKKLVIAMDEVANKYKEVIDKMNKYMYSGYLINSKEIKDILKEVK